MRFLPQPRPLVRLVRHPDLRDQRQGHVRQCLPGREGLAVFRRVQARQHAGIGARRRLLQAHDARLPGVVAPGIGVVRPELPAPLLRRARRHAQQLLAHRDLGIVATRLPLPGLQEPRNLPLHAGAVEAFVLDPRHVEDAFADHPQLPQLRQHLLQHRLGYPVHASQQPLFPLEQGERPLLPSQVGNRRRQARRYQRRGFPQPPAPGAVRMRQAFLQRRLLKLFEAVNVRPALAVVAPPVHPVGRHHVHQHLYRRPRYQAAKQVLQHRRHLFHRSVGNGPDVARLHFPHAAQGGVTRVVGFLQQNHAVFRVADARAVRQQQGKRRMVGAGDLADAVHPRASLALRRCSHSSPHFPGSSAMGAGAGSLSSSTRSP